MATTVPNGTELSFAGSSAFAGSWKTYPIPTTGLTQPAKNAGIEYHYKPISYKITYDLGGGTNDASNPSTYDVLYGVTLKDPTRTGYEFAGWYDEATGKQVTGINEGATASFSSASDLYDQLSKRTTGDVRLEARWKTRYVDVTFHRNAGTGDATTKTVRMTYADAVSGKCAFSDQGFARTGYTMLGWSYDASATSADYSVTNGVNGDWVLQRSPKVDLYATWKINKYYVDVNEVIDGKYANYWGKWDGKSVTTSGDRKLLTFDVYVNGSKAATGVNDYGAEIEYGSTVEVRNVQPADGFTLDTTSTLKETVPAQSSGIEVRLNTVQYKITYDLDGGTFGDKTAPTSYRVTDGDVAVPDPTGEHRVFLGWTGSNGTTPQAGVTIPAGSTGDRSYEAHWRATRYTVRYDKNSADATGSVADQAAEWGKAITISDGSGLSRTGWHVASWNTAADGTGTKVLPGISTSNLTAEDGATVTLYAQWEPNAYTIEYDKNAPDATGTMSPTAAPPSRTRRRCRRARSSPGRRRPTPRGRAPPRAP